ncbi:MAG: glycosyltransferase [Candidatus Omnitrophota bacterium]
MKKTIIVFLPCEWGHPWRGFYLLSALAELMPEMAILCIENPIDYVISPLKNYRQWRKNHRKQKKVRTVKPNLFVYQPWIFLNTNFAVKIPFLDYINRKVLKRQISKILEQAAMPSSLIVWLTDPFQLSYADLFPGVLKIFDCFDDYTMRVYNRFFRTKKELIAKEDEILATADMTLVVSQELYEAKQAKTKNLRLISNAADIRHFGKVDDPDIVVAKEMQQLPSPVIGFVGNFSYRIDTDLISWIAERNKDWTFVFIGSRMHYKEMRELQAAHRNIHLFEFRPYEKLPSYIKAFNVCIIPYKMDSMFSRFCSPLKVYEYLATGKPVVSTDLPGVADFSGIVRIAHNDKNFESQIRESLREDGQLAEKRKEIAAKHSWQIRAAEVKDILVQITEVRG